MDTGSLNLAWARGLVDALIEAGLGHACISPGSRSTPLTLALVERPELTTSVHIDERSAAFFALGQARASGRPALLVCTSGSAGAHYLPAIIEASQDRVPLIALTADRPPELRDTGAWQTIDQIKLFGGFTRWFCEAGAPFEGAFGLRYARDLGLRAAASALGPIPGPVHLNLAFREPLLPEPPTTPTQPEPTGIRGPAPRPGPAAAPTIAPFEPALGAGAPKRSRLPRAGRAFAPPDPTLLDAIAEGIAAAPRGLILAGRLGPLELAPTTSAGLPAYREALAALAAASGYPILAEPAGGLRFGPHDRSRVIAGYEACLRAAAWRDAQAPQLVLRFGASFTWKQVAGYLAAHPGAEQLLVDPLERWDDPTRSGGRRIGCDPIALARGLAERLPSAAAGDPGWLDAWRRADAAAGEVVAALAEPTVAAGSVAWVYPCLIAALPDGALLQVANSMAVRDLDSFAPAVERDIQVLVNRGAAGIDGTLSSALGAALGAGRPTTLVTGDLAFLHDLNGLGAVGAEAADLQVIVLNDAGGGIFAHLPSAASVDPETFARYFRTPPGADIAAACATYGVAHRRIAGAEALAQALRQRPRGLQVLEIAIDLEANTRLHRRLWQAAARQLSD
ncbi:MAG: 2-succinyl-5-enolpyruvyl-6-hydroxy-3-cyclohexene-1-carboxylic-acid synthase [Chloroflexi bacterium]|nr:2-succinyl-5-enolpyruvyl-6-hydroxy-3-cyclohexene-1-carboxylic-acid synthase [Chloroflexota bacterium]